MHAMHTLLLISATAASEGERRAQLQGQGSSWHPVDGHYTRQAETKGFTKRSGGTFAEAWMAKQVVSLQRSKAREASIADSKNRAHKHRDMRARHREIL